MGHCEQKELALELFSKGKLNPQNIDFFPSCANSSKFKMP